MRKRTLSAILLSPILLLVAIYALLISPLAGPTVKLIANSFVTNLSIDDIEGSFADTLEIHNLQWENAQWRVLSKYAYIDVTWRCFFEPKVCVNELTLENATLTQLAAAPETVEETNAGDEFSLPIPIEVGYLSLTDINVALLTTTVEVDELELTNFNGNQALALDSLATKGVRITLIEQNTDTSSVAANTASQAQSSLSQQTPKQSTEKTAKQATPDDKSALPSSYSLSYEVPELPTITAPIPVSLGTLLVEDLHFIQGASTQKISLISLLDAQFKDSDIAIEEMVVAHEQGEVKAKANATFSENFPLSIAARAKTVLDDAPLTINLNASGALDDLALSVNTKGAVNADANLAANVLNTELPIEFTAKWKEQPIPTMENATLKAGTLSLEGTMGDYQLKGAGAATLPDIGNVPVSLDVVLKKNNIYVNQANIQALEGSLVNTGTLYLNESIAWEGKTTLSNVSAQRFSTYAPENLSGEIESILQYSERGGLHMSLKDMQVSGVLQDKPLEIIGNAVYAGPSDLFVTNVNIIQEGENEKNAIRAIAQVLNKRHLNADITISANTINSLYPEVSGAINGKISASGPWQNPSANGKLSLSNVTVSPNLNTSAAQQGPLSGEVTLDGTYKDHQAQVDLSVPGNQVAFSFKGAWTNNHWIGQISDTKLELANMQWILSSPFTLDIGTAPVTAKIGQHCWTSRREGELCISNVNYQDSKASWDIKATSLPVGLWANELVPTMVSAPSEATLSVQTKGSYSQQDPIDASFTASMSTAPWQLGETRPLTLTINSFETNGKIRQGQLESTSLISSQDIGDATLTLNTRPFEEKIPLDGKLVMEGLDVAPLKPLSPAIRTLTGLLNGNITLSGYVDDPSLNGELTVSNGAIDIQDTPVTLANWNQKVVLSDQTAALDGSFVLGGGKGTLKGELDWSSEPSATFKLKGNSFEIRQPNIRLKVSPNIDVAATKEKVDVTGEVNIPWARIEVESLPESAVSPSKDVHLRGEPDKEEPLDIVHASVLLNIDKNKTEEVKLEAFGLTASLFGGIRVNTQPALVGYGDLQIINGRYSAYDQQLIIQTGEVQFNGPIDQPLLLVEAIRDPAKTDDDVIAGIRIDGATDAPSINLFSEPSMDQQGVLSYLLTGSGPDSGGSSDPNYAALLLGFGLSNTETLTGQLGSALGIDDFSLSTNENMLSVTGQINDRLSVEYNVDVGLSNNDANSTLRRRQLPPDLALKYQLLPSLYLEAIQTTLEDQSEFALDLYYEFFLGDTRTRKDDDNDGDDDSNDTDEADNNSESSQEGKTNTSSDSKDS
ncbi:translocation/assembly module TamB domain-containing protein [Alteromonas sp. ALT199]|uniref:translocation/assembly module TamB domain-containing protein n=1 Tax=unclassified Alteromonas TaxID=2614992 RepID=UPI001BEA2873|nr:translocation/assembly module TamB domain-containing protein [Alteromonas sp. ALT199]MBT3133770.1 translocation/assembly module TamB domain-containing protein [Alteromonas sp. ALT199]